MAVRRVFTILGCGSSPGVPRINGDWGACDPANPKNRRSRAALLIEQTGADGGTTTIVIDTGPDFREQMIAANVKTIDAVFYSHPHADHIHGIDDLRGYVQSTGRRMPIWADAPTMERIREGFGYCMETPAGSNYPPIVEPNIIDPSLAPVAITGAGGTIRLQPVLQHHGSIMSMGFRIGGFAYCSDVSDFPPDTIGKLTVAGHAGDRHAAVQIPPEPSVAGTVTRLDRTVFAEARRAHPYAYAAGLRDGDARNG